MEIKLHTSLMRYLEGDIYMRVVCEVKDVRFDFEKVDLIDNVLQICLFNIKLKLHSIKLNLVDLL